MGSTTPACCPLSAHHTLEVAPNTALVLGQESPPDLHLHEAKRAATAESVPKLILVVEMVKVSDCGTVPEIFIWLLFSITLVISPTSPKPPDTEAVYEPAVVGFVELAAE